MSPVWMFVMACVRRGDVPAALPPVEPVAVPAIATGRLEGDRFVDASGVSFLVPAAWSSRVGAEPEALRWSGASAMGTRLAVERSDRERALPVLEGCAWSFTDEGPYRVVRGIEHLRVTTCVPESAEGPRALAWTFDLPAGAWTVQMTAPPGGLGEGLDAALDVLRSFETAGPPRLP